MSSARVEGGEAGGRLVLTERGATPAQGRLAVEDTATRVRQTTSIFTVVQDGSVGRLLVAREAPYRDVAFFHDYASGRDHLASTVRFYQVGTWLGVRPTILGDGSIRVRLTPHITYATAAGGGEVEFVEAATELIVPDGRPVPLGGSTGALHSVMRRILGSRATASESDVTVTVTASAR